MVKDALEQELPSCVFSKLYPEPPKLTKVVQETVNPSIKRPLNYLWFFTKQKVPRYASLGDADLTNFLRLHCYCQPRTMPLVHSLKLKAIQFMSDFDTTGMSMGELYRIISSSIAAAIIPSKDEEMLLETIKSASNLMENMQPFFTEGQYQKPGLFTVGKTLNHHS